MVRASVVIAVFLVLMTGMMNSAEVRDLLAMAGVLGACWAVSRLGSA